MAYHCCKYKITHLVSSTPLNFKLRRCFEALFNAPSLNCFLHFRFEMVPNLCGTVWSKKAYDSLWSTIFIYFHPRLFTWHDPNHFTTHAPSSINTCINIQPIPCSAISKTHRITPSNLHAIVFAQVSSGHFTLWTILLQAVPQSQFHDLPQVNVHMLDKIRWVFGGKSPQQNSSDLVWAPPVFLLLIIVKNSHQRDLTSPFSGPWVPLPRSTQSCKMKGKYCINYLWISISEILMQYTCRINIKKASNSNYM